LSELAEYRRIHGHCNVPKGYSDNIQLGTWVSSQRKYYRFLIKGETSPMTALRIQALERLGFKWDCCGATWEDRLSELADYRRIHGHCNVPQRYSKNTKLGRWAIAQRTQYRFHKEGKKCQMTIPRIQELESLGFRMGQPRGSLDRSFERACRLSKNPRALQCSDGLQRKHQAGLVGLNPKEALQVAPKRRNIIFDPLPYPGIRKSGF
jgi:hypothetical protein